LQAADGVKVIILVNYNSLIADRARGLKDLLEICTQLFGNTENLESFQDSVLLGVTQAPKNANLNSLRKRLIQDTSKVMQVLSKRLFLYDPLNCGGSEFWSHDRCVSEIAALKAIPQVQSRSMFQTVLTPDDEKMLVQIVDKQSQDLMHHLMLGDYDKSGGCWRLLHRLKVIDNSRVDDLLHSVQLRIQDKVTERVASFKKSAMRYEFDEAERMLASISDICSHFPTATLTVNQDELRMYLKRKKKRHRRKKILLQVVRAIIKVGVNIAFGMDVDICLPSIYLT
jgi:hypothetical protein